MIWEPFVLALALGLIVSAGLYFAYLWPSVEPIDDDNDDDDDRGIKPAAPEVPASTESA